MAYIECRFKLSPFYPFNEIAVAELSELGFESFSESEETLLAYIPREDFNEEVVRACPLFSYEELKLEFQFTEIAKENWNQKWEESFEPVEVTDFCIVRAPFHASDKVFQHEIIIEPKMSFGTGHHATTQLMILAMQGLNLKNQSVLDMGSGTGILAILAKQLNAAKVVAIDIEDWAYENMIENFERNHTPTISAHLGGVEWLEKIGSFYDCILANINKNILKRDIPSYLACLNSKGFLALSGFFTHDADEMVGYMKGLDMELVKQASQDDWACLLFQKTA